MHSTHCDQEPHLCCTVSRSFLRVHMSGRLDFLPPPCSSPPPPPSSCFSWIASRQCRRPLWWAQWWGEPRQAGEQQPGRELQNHIISGYPWKVNIIGVYYIPFTPMVSMVSGTVSVVFDGRMVGAKNISLRLQWTYFLSLWKIPNLGKFSSCK